VLPRPQSWQLLNKLWSCDVLSLVTEEISRTPAERLATARIAPPMIAGTGFADRISANVDRAVDMGEQAMAAALTRAGIRSEQVDMMVLVSSTPAMARVDLPISARIGLRCDTKRLPLFGLGTVGDAAGLSRVHDYLRSYPSHVAAMLSVDICLPPSRCGDSCTSENMGLYPYGKGTASVIVTGAHHIPEQAPVRPKPKILATRSRFVPDPIDVSSSRLTSTEVDTVVLQDLPGIVDLYLRQEVAQFLADYGLSTSDIATWVCHPGGSAIVESIDRFVGPPRESANRSWKATGGRGALSSTSILDVLARAIAEPPAPGSWGVMIAIGPGVFSELLLLRW
jgi:alkylresorcinol/alkylpyrone synthase